MTGLADVLAHSIRLDGPLPLRSYMQACLLHPQFGYYATRDPLGRAGDFITAPEISQMFGELLGLALAQIWVDQGRPDPFVLAEVGPGRGTCMADMLRATKAVPGFHAAARVTLIEASATLRAVQRATLAEHSVAWGDQVEDLPQGPLLLLANEFFDALPIDQYRRTAVGWQARVVTVHDGALTLDWTAPEPVPDLRDREGDCQPGDIVEICPQAQQIARQLAKRIATQGGAALIVDYGDKRSLGDTLQAVRSHAFADPMAAPGQADLTAHVDFGALADAALAGSDGRIRVSGLTRQGVLLERLGITARAQTLARSLTGDALSSHIAAHRRLTHSAEMGTLFKALALTPRGAPPPPGFDP